MKGMWYCDTEILMVAETIIIIIWRRGRQGMVLRGSASSGYCFGRMRCCTLHMYVWYHSNKALQLNTIHLLPTAITSLIVFQQRRLIA